MDHWVRVTLRIFSLGIEPATSEVSALATALPGVVGWLEGEGGRGGGGGGVVYKYEQFWVPLGVNYNLDFKVLEPRV